MVPVFPFLPLYVHGSRELGLTIKEYFSDYENIVEGQKRLYNKFRSDCVTGITYAAKEVEAFGGDVVFFENGSPNAGKPVIKSLSDIEALQLPVIPGRSTRAKSAYLKIR